MFRRIVGGAIVAGAVLLALLAAQLAGGPAGAQPVGGCQTFTQTGKTVCGRFLLYWQEHGGLAQQGYPISGEFTEVSDLNGKPYTVQYFERAVFELHPENAPPYDVLLSQLGTYQFQAKYAGVDPGGSVPTATAVPTTVADDTPPRMALADFKTLYDNPATRPIILDVRSSDLYEAGHIKGAISFPEADVDTRVGELPKDRLIVAYCQ
jgi:hypothetical protein